MSRARLLKACRSHGHDIRFAAHEIEDGGITLLTSSQREGFRAAVNGIMLTRDERLALTQYLIENPVVVNPKRLA